MPKNRALGTDGTTAEISILAEMLYRMLVFAYNAALGRNMDLSMER